MTDHVHVIRDFIVETFLFGEAGALTPTQSLLRSGVLDSTGVMELILFLEQKFGVKVEDSEVVPDNLDSIASISAFLERKLAGRTVGSARAS